MNIIPWLELTQPTKEKRIYCLQGLREWAKHADRAMVTTWPEYVPDSEDTLGLYRWLTDVVSSLDIQVIGGIKTSRILGTNPASFADWSEVRVVAEQVAKDTGYKTVVLDNELTFEPWSRGEQDINPWQFREAIMSLADSDVQYYWYQPAIHDDDPRFRDRHYRSKRLVEIIADTVPNSLFDDTSMAWADWLDNERQEVDRRNELRNLVGIDRVHERLIVTPDGVFKTAGRWRQCHTPREARALIDYTGLDHTMPYGIYPGHDRWLSTAKAWGGEGRIAKDG